MSKVVFPEDWAFGILLAAVVFCGSGFVTKVKADGVAALQTNRIVHRRDTLIREMPHEVQGFRSRMMSSSLPVDIQKQGRQLCITSKYNQLLPVYRDNGTFYTAFRVAKGTNWLTGLPKGTYIINNRRFTIS